MIQVLSIVPYPDMEATVRAVLDRYACKEEVRSKVEVVTVDRLENVDFSCCDVVIARGYTARVLKERNLEIPVVEMHISAYDVLRAIEECRQHMQPRVMGFVGFYSAFYGMEQFSFLLGCRIQVCIPRSVQDIDAAIEDALKRGCDVIIGGYSVYLRARARGLPAYILRSGEEAFGAALEEAVRAVELVRQERVKIRMHQIITQCAHTGILYVDATGIIRIDNHASRTLAQQARTLSVSCGMTERGFTAASSSSADIDKTLVGKELASVFSGLQDCFVECLHKNKEFLGELRQSGPITLSLDCIPVEGHGSPAGAVISFQNITKVQQLEGQIRKKLSDRGLVAKHSFEDIIHSSHTIAETIENARRYAHASSNILIVGETGTGKELFAQSIHNASPRCGGPFVAVNCAALPENLLESELFGYVEGAFTGTMRGGKMGLFELAHNGTLFLDEISEIAIGVQSKLLRALQEKEVRRVGDDKVIVVNVRVISATNKNLYHLVSSGLFRQDLLYRLDVLKIFLPPLNRREDDVLELFHYFLRIFAAKRHEVVPNVEAGALELLRTYRFVGNARELRNVVERVCVLKRQGDVLTREDMERALYPEDIDSADLVLPSRGDMEVERDIIRRAVADCGGNQTRAARLLGVDRSTLWRKLRKYGLR